MTLRILVTGATDGIGFATAKQLLVAGADVLVHGRNQARAEAAITALAKHVDVSGATAVWADFESMANVVALANQLKSTGQTLDVLINNAGIYASERRMTIDGFELTMAVNYFAPYLLTRELESVLQSSAAPRVVNVSSMTHQSARLDIDDLELNRGWDPYGAYATSKLCNILFTVELARRAADTNLTTNALHPGVVGTKLLRQGFSMGGISSDDGAKTSVYLATSDDVAQISGQYFVDRKRSKASSEARNTSLAEALWRVTEQKLYPRG